MLTSLSSFLFWNVYFSESGEKTISRGKLFYNFSWLKLFHLFIEIWQGKVLRPNDCIVLYIDIYIVLLAA